MSAAHRAPLKNSSPLTVRCPILSKYSSNELEGGGVNSQYCVIGLIAAANFLSVPPARCDEDPLFRSVQLSDDAGMEVGRGFDILTGNPRADCVDRAVKENHPSFGPNSIRFRSVRIESSAQLDKALGVSASASVNTGYGSGNASASFSNALSVTSYSLNYFVKASVDGKGDGLRDVHLKPNYSRLIGSGSKESLKRFRDVCGDGYIGEFTMGAEFRAFIQIVTHSKTETDSLAVSAGGALGMASGAASFSSTLKDIAKTNEVHILSEGRGGSGPIPITPDEISAKSSNLPVQAKESATPVAAAVFSYVTVLDDPKIPLSDFNSREVALSYLADLKQRLKDQRADAQYILDHPSEFYSSPTDLPQLSAEVRALDAYDRLIMAKATACINGDGNCTTIGQPFPHPLARPARR